MKDDNPLKRIAPLFVALGAISYGIPGSLFKMAHGDRVTDSLLLSMCDISDCLSRLQLGTLLTESVQSPSS